MGAGFCFCSRSETFCQKRLRLGVRLGAGERRRSARAGRAARGARWVGVSTNTRTCWSPRPPPWSAGTPLPLRRNTLPVWVPAGILSLAGPSSVGTSMVAPSAACAKESGHLAEDLGLLALEDAGARGRGPPRRGRRAAPPAGAGLALAGELEPGAGVDAGRDLHLDAGLLAHRAGAAAGRAAVRDDAPGAAAVVAGPGDGEEALGEPELAGAAAGGAGPRAGAGLGAACRGRCSQRLGAGDGDAGRRCRRPPPRRRSRGCSAGPRRGTCAPAPAAARRRSRRRCRRRCR